MNEEGYEETEGESQESVFFCFLRVKKLFYHRIKCSVTPAVIALIHHRAKEDTLLSLSFAGLFFLF